MVGKYYFELDHLMDVYEFLRFLDTGAMSGNSIPREVLNNMVLGCVKIPGWVPTAALLLINQLRDSDNQFDGHYPLIYMLCTEKYHATNPRDKIYAILGIGQSSLLPDYSKSVETVYTEFAESCLQHDYWWLLFCVGGLGNQIPSSLSVPSWVPDWHALSAQIDAPEGLGTWTGFESGKGLKVSGETRPYVDDMTRLHTPGMVVDAVADVAPPVDGTPEELRDFCNELTSHFPRANHENMGLTHMQAVFNTLTMSLQAGRRTHDTATFDRTAIVMAWVSFLLFSSLEPPADGIYSSELAALTESGEAGKFTIRVYRPHAVLTDVTLDELQQASESPETIDVVEYMMRLLTNHRLFCTEKEMLGLAPPLSLPGDKIVIVPECIFCVRQALHTGLSGRVWSWVL